MTRGKSFWLGLCFLLLVGCVSEEDAAPSKSYVSEESVLEEAEEYLPQEEKIERTVEELSSYIVDEKEEDGLENDASEDLIKAYSSEEIEYARIWSQLGPNQEVDELYVQHISAGELINPNVESSAAYPEDVIQLSGSRLVDGSITYSGNGDGTVNIYHVPLRWETNIPKDFNEEDMEIFTESIIHNTELVAIDTGNDEEIIALIEKIKK